MLMEIIPNQANSEICKYILPSVDKKIIVNILPKTISLETYKQAKTHIL